MPPRTQQRSKRRVGKMATTRSQPYPPPRPLGDSVRVNRQRSDNSESSEEESDAESTPRKRLGRRDLGMPSRDEYDAAEAEYLGSLDRRKKGKALISREMFDKIWFVLHNPDVSKVETPQFRWWVRKMFRLEERLTRPHPPSQFAGSTDQGLTSSVVVHGGKEVAIKEDIYDILCECHQRADHGGRDRTAAGLRERYTWVPKELIAGFVKRCPTCIYKRTGKCDEERAARYEEDQASALEAIRSAQRNERVDNLHAPSLMPLIPIPGGELSRSHDATGHLFRASPALIPWYMSSAGSSHPGDLGLRSDPGDTSDLGYWDRRTSYPPQSHPSLSLAPHHRTVYDEHVTLPSIHTCGRAFQPPADCAKITLPPLAQLLGASGHAAHLGSSLVRHPLEVIPGNSLPLSKTDSNDSSQRMPYIPQIDPALLPGGVHMLALAAESAQMAGTNWQRD
ncbi:hypothetical protein GY45DRAFT_93201 [Cubamyces sp. BRFM 1775]|nr:hypothetical protein GY45DRAFT_93201 [Cubamyces sp. BRFM 1775]